MPRLSGRLAPLVVLACLIVGCTAPTPPPTPAPSYRCTPEAGGAEFDCTQHQHDEMVAKDKLYAEAEAVYRAFLVEDIRVARAGGLEEPTEALLRTATGPFLEDVMAGYREDKRRGVRVRGGDRVIKSVARLPGISKGGSLVALRVCVDSSTIQVFRDGKRVGDGLITSDSLFFTQVEHQLKILGADGQEVQSCGS